MRHIQRHTHTQTPDEMSCAVWKNCFFGGQGIIPKFIINFVAPRKPGEWIEALKKARSDIQSLFRSPRRCISREACLEYQAANPDFAHLKQDDETDSIAHVTCSRPSSHFRTCHISIFLGVEMTWDQITAVYELFVPVHASLLLCLDLPHRT